MLVRPRSATILRLIRRLMIMATSSSPVTENHKVIKERFILREKLNLSRTHSTDRCGGNAPLSEAMGVTYHAQQLTPHPVR
jgi:hypothetical protein